MLPMKHKQPNFASLGDCGGFSATAGVSFVQSLFISLFILRPLAQ
jgi:hypothetical protein